MSIEDVHLGGGSTNLSHVARTRNVAFSFSDVAVRRPLVPAPAARPVLQSGVFEVLELAEADTLLPRVGRDDGVQPREEISREVDAIPVPADQQVQAVAAVLLPVRVVPAETGLRARGQVERSCEVFEVHAV